MKVVNKTLLQLIIMWGLLCSSASRLPAAREDSRKIGDRNQRVVVNYLWRVASASDVAIRLYYRGRCSTRADFVIPFPSIKVQPPPKGKTPVAAIREIFERDKNVTVREDANGIIRIWIGKMPTAILQTKISDLTLDEMAQYNPDQAIVVINNTKEVKAAVDLLALKPAWSASSARALPQKELPHLPAHLKDMTVEQILDLMAKTWDGPVIFGACAEKTADASRKWFFIDSAQDIIPKGAWRKRGQPRPEPN